MNAEDLEAARAVAFRFIGYAARSRSEMEKRLEREEYAPDIIAAVRGRMRGGGVDRRREVRQRLDRRPRRPQKVRQDAPENGIAAQRH